MWSVQTDWSRISGLEQLTLDYIMIHAFHSFIKYLTAYLGVEISFSFCTNDIDIQMKNHFSCTKSLS